MSEIDYYLTQIGKYPLLTKEEEAEASPELLVKSNLRLVVFLAKRYLRNSNEELVDLVQYGNIGLIKASQRYKSELAGFAHFAGMYIRAEIRNNLRDRLGKFVRARKELPDVYGDEELVDPFAKCELEREALYDKISKLLSEKEQSIVLARLVGYSHIEIGQALGFTHQNASLIEKRAIGKLRDNND